MSRVEQLFKYVRDCVLIVLRRGRSNTILGPDGTVSGLFSEGLVLPRNISEYGRHLIYLQSQIS